MRIIAEGELTSYLSRQANRPRFSRLPPKRIEVSMQSLCRKLTRPISFSIVILMLVGYALMGCMMAEQNRTISAQRDLIDNLFQDSIRLWVAKVDQNKLIQQR